MISLLLWLRRIAMTWFFRRCAFAVLAIFALLTMCGCATTIQQVGNPDTCDPTESEPGHPACLPVPGFFCRDPDAQSKNISNIGQDAKYAGQLFPSAQALGANQPICPPNATRLVQDEDWKDAKYGAKKIGRTIGRVLATCERIVEKLAEHPDNILAGYNTIQPEELEDRFKQCTRELDSLPEIPAYEDPWLAGAAAEGFKEGYGEGEQEVWLRLFLLDMALASLEAVIMPASALIEVAVTRGMRASLNAVRRMPIFIPGAIGVGAFAKGVPRAVAKAVAEGSSRILGRNLKLAGLIRLPGEFAHHIVAFGDHRAKKALDILKKFAIDVDDAVNGVFLPGYKSSPNPKGKIVHGNLHTNAYYEAVEEALLEATTQAEVIQRLRWIAFKLEHGMMP